MAAALRCARDSRSVYLVFVGIVLSVLVYCVCETSAEPLGGNSAHAQLMEKARQRAEQLRDRVMPAQPSNEANSSAGRVKSRDGVYLLVSWSIPAGELNVYLREAHRLGMSVMFRGFVEDDMTKTVARTKAVALELLKDTPHIAIDPIIFRNYGVTRVPALVIAKEQHAVFVEGAAPVRTLLGILARDKSVQGGLQPLVEWADDRFRSWERGGPVDSPRPPLPKFVKIQRIPSTLQTYPIWERDVEAVIQERLRTVDLKPWRDGLQRKVEERLKSGPGLTLPVAIAPRTFMVDMTQHIASDIPNHDGSVIVVKAGTSVNPLLYVPYRHRLVVIDGRDAKQVAFAKAQIQQYGAPAIKVLLTDGDVGLVMKEVQDRVYWLQPNILSRFKLEHIPSVISQNGPMMQVDEVAL